MRYPALLVIKHKQTALNINNQNLLATSFGWKMENKENSNAGKGKWILFLKATD